MSDPFERTPIAQAPLSITLSAYNAEAVLEKVLGNWTTYLETLAREYEILVVDDGSTDGTAERAVALGTRYPRTRLLQYGFPQGIGTAIRTGLAAAQFPLFFYAECSLAYQPADLASLLEVIDKVDLVSGQRIWQSGRRQHIGSYFAYRAFLRLLFGLRLKDVDCVFKLFRRSVFTRIPIQSAGPFVHAEILAKANFLGSIMTEVPVRYEPNHVSQGAPASLVTWRTDASRVFFRPEFGPAGITNH